MNILDGAHYQRLIEARIRDLREQSETTRQTRDTVELDQQSVGRLSRMDAIQRKAMADATEQRRHLEIEQLNAALKRIASEEFGYCLDCGEKIEARRIEQNLTVFKCISCAKG